MNAMDWISFFDDFGIEYVTDHKHVTEGWVNINCPFCGDSNFHLGVNLSGSGVHCWRCGTHSKFDLIKELSGENPAKILKLYSGNPIVIKAENKNKVTKLKFPKEFGPLNKKAKNYLVRRGYDPNHLETIYGLKYAKTGKWCGRIIIPYFENGKLLTWQGRTIFNDKIRYKGLSKKESIKTVKQVLYNEQFTKQDFVIVFEGVFDVWQWGFGAISVAGTGISNEQKQKLLKYKNIVLCFDSDDAGIMAMIELAEILKFYNKPVWIVILNKNVLDAKLNMKLTGNKVLKFNLNVKDFSQLSNNIAKKVKQKIMEVTK